MEEGLGEKIKRLSEHSDYLMLRTKKLAKKMDKQVSELHGIEQKALQLIHGINELLNRQSDAC